MQGVPFELQVVWEGKLGLLDLHEQLLLEREGRVRGVFGGVLGVRERVALQDLHGGVLQEREGVLEMQRGELRAV